MMMAKADLLPFIYACISRFFYAINALQSILHIRRRYFILITWYLSKRYFSSIVIKSHLR